MKKPVVDYRTFRLTNINEPQFAHLKLLAGWIVYFALYFITENLIPTEKCYVVHGRLDDVIPFCEGFVVAYVLWYVLIVGSLLYFGLYNIDGFKKMSKYIFFTQMAAMLIYIVFPNRQDLRPEVFPRDNFFSWLVGLIYSFDTNTNVCPSLHVAYSLGIASVWVREKPAPVWFRTLIVLFVISVCLSVAFIKQHSVVDIFAALPMCLMAELIFFRKEYKALLNRIRARKKRL